MENLTKSERLQASIESLQLKQIETTSERNGYPSHLKDAVIGFDTFEQAKEFADSFGFEITFFEKRDGWQLWYRTGNTVFYAMEITSSHYGDNYRQIDPGYIDEEEFFEEEVNEILKSGDFKDFDSLQEFIEAKKLLWEEVERAEAGKELVITNEGRYFETVKTPCTYFSHDTKHLAIGCVIDWKETEDDE